MCALGFDHYIDPLTLYLHKYRETTKSDRNLVNGDVIEATFEDSTTDFSEFVFNENITEFNFIDGILTF